ncbi:helix-turn-helix transcriptional regulator [Methanobrevibacter sp.]|uniref:helix-turn-helix transcriptional regulator n=1 Tax=Methanobrevibacter sp. TaxID=66852 RepID=UPI003863D39A
MNENTKYLENYDFVSEDVKYIANSVIRLKILAALFEKPQNMKELSTNTKLGYSSISSIIHGLEVEDFVFRESNKYYLVNSLKALMKHILEVKEVVNLLNRVFNIVDGHVVDMIPEESVNELHLLENVELLESGGIDAYRIHDFIEDALSGAERVRCILPFYQLNINKKLNDLVRNGKVVEVMVSDEVFEIYEEKSESKYLYSFKQKNNFFLIVSDEVMIFGLFKENGYFDQNRLLTSKNQQCVFWANGLFRNFKKKNK